jgi:hypothetical protein
MHHAAIVPDDELPGRPVVLVSQIGVDRELHLFAWRQVLHAKEQYLVAQKGVVDRAKGRFIDSLGEIGAEDLGAELRRQRSDVEQPHFRGSGFAPIGGGRCIFCDTSIRRTAKKRAPARKGQGRRSLWCYRAGGGVPPPAFFFNSSC